MNFILIISSMLLVSFSVADTLGLEEDPNVFVRLTNESMQKTTLEMLRNDSEIAFFSYELNNPENKLVFTRNTNQIQDLEFDLFLLKTVKVKNHIGWKTKYDPLQPIIFGISYQCDLDCGIVVRLKTTKNSKAGQFDFDIKFQEGRQNIEIPISVHVLDLTNPDHNLSIQASVGKVPDYSFQNAMAVYKELEKFGVNVASVSPSILSKSPSIIRQILEQTSIKKARATLNLTARSINRANTEDVETQIEDFVAATISDLKVRGVTEEHNSNFYHLKLWDEPSRKDLKLVNDLYAAIKRELPDITMEISGLKSLGDVADADIFVTRLQDLNQELIFDAQSQNKEIWLYANSMHSLRRPYSSLINIGWLIWLFGLDGYHFWDTTKWSHDSFAQVITQSDFLGRGLLLYPINDDSVVRFLPSLRLLMFSKGLDDYKLLRLMEKEMGARWAREFRSKLYDEMKFKQGKKRYFFNTHSLRSELINALKENHS